jgi:hypothetical protein
MDAPVLEAGWVARAWRDTATSESPVLECLGPHLYGEET